MQTVHPLLYMAIPICDFKMSGCCTEFVSLSPLQFEKEKSKSSYALLSFVIYSFNSLNYITNDSTS